jgi:amino acid adenylation domain-containing protein/FkbM family methyltransferase
MNAVPAQSPDGLSVQLPNVTLPLSRPRSKAYSAKRASALLALEDAAAAALGADEGERIAILISAVAAVLHRYSGEGSICIGTASRLLAPPNALPVVVNLDPQTTAGALRGRVGTALQTAFSMASLPFARTIERLGLTEATNQNPLFSVAVRDAKAQAPLGPTRCDVVLTIPAEGPPTLEADHSARLFSVSTITRFLEHVARMLAHMREHERPVSSMDYLTPTERSHLFAVGMGAVDPVVPDDTVVAMFRRQAERSPDAPALYAEGQAWTYAQLDSQTDLLAAILQERGIRHGDRIGLCILIGASQLMWALALLKCGAAVVPFDWTFPSSRIHRLYQNAGVRDLVTERAVYGLFPEGTRAMLVEDAADGRPRLRFRPPRILGTDPIYMLYTSGSTGTPKAVVMPHRALANLVAWQHRQSGPRAARTMQRTSISFDVSWQEIFSTWCFGGQLVLATDDQRADISSWPTIFEQHQVTRVFLPVVALHQLAEVIRAPLRSLQELIVAGEQLRITPAVRRMFQLLDARLVNQYGPTETHVVTHHQLGGPSQEWPALPPIGTPIDNARVVVMDPFGDPCPLGIDGEICVAGLPLALGYHADEELSAQKFTRGETSELRNVTFYMTGDFGHFTEAGNLEFTGRRDTQVKLRGYRIDLAELECALASMPGIRQAAASIWVADDGERRLAAHVVQSEGARLSPVVIRAWLRERLPEYMIPPTTCILLGRDPLPLTPSGKIDRGNLPLPKLTPDAEHVPAKGIENVAETVRGIWAHHLHVGNLAPRDGFLELGGHSLLAIHVVSELNEALGTAIALRELLRGPTLETFTEVVEKAVRARDQTPAGQVDPPVESTIQVTLPTGLKIFTPFAPEAHYLYSDIYEHRTYEQDGVSYYPGACIFDLGANIGLFTLYAAARAPGCKVIAVEPAIPLWESLRRNVAHLGEQVTPINCAISNREGVAQLTYYPAIPGMSSLYPDSAHERALLTRILENLAAKGRTDIREIMAHQSDFVGQRLEAEKYPCRLRTLSSLRRELGIEAIDLLKIDVQKAELDVLEGIHETDWPRIRQVVVEVHDIEGRAARIAALLAARGYAARIGEPSPLHQGSVIRFVYASRPPG